VILVVATAFGCTSGDTYSRGIGICTFDVNSLTIP
jgi:hypothetical protein